MDDTSASRTLRRRLIAAGALAGLNLISARSQAATATTPAWPTKPVKLIVPFTPGGASDVAARTVSVALQQAIGQPVVVDYKPGANGNLGADYVVKSGHDGHTLLVTDVIGQASSPAVYGQLGFDPSIDLQGVCMLTYAPHLIAVNPDVPAQTFAELVALSKRQPITCAISAVGSPPHLACVQLQKITGARWEYVPYKGGSQAMTDTIAGQTQMIINSLAPTLPYVQSGRLRAIALSNKGRMALVTQIPTLDESGAPGFSSGSWQGVMASSSVPAGVVAQIHAALATILRDTDLRAKVLAQGAQVSLQAPADMNAFFARERKRWEAVARENHIKAG
ncbi:tripartite tricarboxylate transporter substrate binding protein [soil metagenome]